MRSRAGLSWGFSLALSAQLATSVGLGALIGCAGQTPKAEANVPLREVQQARWFAGPDGMHVEVLDFADDTSLVRILGVSSELTDKVLSYQRVQNGDRLEYRTKWHGGDLYALNKERDGNWVAYVPGAQNGYHLTYQEDKTSSVDSAAIQREHAAQEKSGELSALQKFDRPARQKYNDDALAEAAASASKDCGKPLPVSINWPSVTDEQMLEMSVSGYCESLVSGVKRLCQSAAGKAFVAQHVNALECTLDGDNTLSAAGNKLRWAINFQISNADQRAYAALLALTPEGGKDTLEEQLFAEQTSVCSDADKKHVVLIGPREAPHHGMAYGDGKQFSWVRTPEALGDGWFFDPRQRNEKNNDNFRGLDLRLFSHIEADPKAGACKLTCGARETQLKLLSGPDKDALLDGATYVAGPMTREPYALARDKAGVYYFVDHGVTPETSRDFKLYKGPRGKLKPLPMKDVVSDSEGEIFASTGGKLRLVLGKQTAQWISGGTATLLLLPLEENYGLIYNELGVYMSARLGVPCDDL